MEDREVLWEEVQKGYEISKDRYVVLEKQDFESIKIRSTRTIDIKGFIDGLALDPIFIIKSVLDRHRKHRSDLTWKSRLYTL